MLDPSMTRRRGARRHRRPAADRRRRRRAGALRRDAAPDASIEAEPGRDEFEIALVARGAAARAADLRDLPRHPGAERRVRRHAGAGHPVAGDRRARRTSLDGAAAPAVRARARSLDRQGLAAARLMRERLSDADSCEVNSRHHQAVKDARAGLQRVAPPRPTASSKRSRIPRRASASASSGTRKTSGAPASSGRCSKASRSGHQENVATGFRRTALARRSA